MKTLPKYRPVVTSPHPVKLIENTWILLSDGVRLAARIWLPQDAEEHPVPAILEYLPFRKNDGTAIRDRVIHEYFAGYGYASVRVDMRGSGDSDGLLAARPCDGAPDGSSRLVSWDLLNLTHRNGHERPKPLEPGQTYEVSVQLNVAAHRMTPGHRWRVAISPTYWPHAWPSPVPVRLTVYMGKESKLVLPVRASNTLDESLRKRFEITLRRF